MSDALLVLLALEPAQQGWQHIADTLFRASGYFTQVDRQALLVWPQPVTARGTAYADGWLIARIWLAPARAGIGIRARRLYFLNGLIDTRMEHDIIKGQRPRGRPADKEIAEQHELLLTLLRGLRDGARVVSLRSATTALEQARTIGIRGSRMPFVSGSANAHYKQHGFARTPDDWQISVCPVDGTRDATADVFVTRLRSLAEQRHARLQTRLVPLRVIDERVTAMGDQLPRAGRCVLFVLPKRAAPPSPLLAQLLQRLDAARIPYRRAYADDNHDYSIPDQLPSLLMACGGLPHMSCRINGAQDVWHIALDLGHALQSDRSVVVAAVISPDGELKHVARTWQSRDETAHPTSVRRLLASCRDALGAHGGGSGGVLVVRDGRHFENEDPAIYGDTLEHPSTTIEFRKRGNPQVALQLPTRLAPVGLVAGQLDDASSMFVSLSSPRDTHSLASIAKVTWHERHNHLKLSPALIAELLAAAAAAPGLGVHPHHLPAGVYWADGIASVSDTDLRFRGVPCHTIA